jgi:hypothetical protein
MPTTAWLVVGTLLGVTLVLLGSTASDSRSARIGWTVLAGGWALLVGLSGFALAALWAFSDQTLLYRNENLLQVSPVFLLVAVSAWGSVEGRVRARWLTVAAAGLAALGLALKLLPAFDQETATIMALTLPAHAGLAWGMWRWTTAPHRCGTTRAFPGS